MASKDQYLQPGFDPNKYTIPDLRSALSDYSIVYPSSAKKSELVEIFKEQIGAKRRKLWKEYTHSNNPNSDGIEIIDLDLNPYTKGKPKTKQTARKSAKSTPLKKVRRSSPEKAPSDEHEFWLTDSETEKASRNFSKVNTFQKLSTSSSPTTAATAKAERHFSDHNDFQHSSAPEIEESILPAKRHALEETPRKAKKILKRSKRRERSADASDSDLSPAPTSRKVSSSSTRSSANTSKQVTEGFELPLSAKRKSKPISAESTFNSIVEKASPRKTPRKFQAKTNPEVEEELERLFNLSVNKSMKSLKKATSGGSLLDEDKGSPFISPSSKRNTAVSTVSIKREPSSRIKKPRKTSNYLSELTKEIEAEVEAYSHSASTVDNSKSSSSPSVKKIPQPVKVQQASSDNIENFESSPLNKFSQKNGKSSSSPSSNTPSKKITYNDFIKSLSKTTPKGSVAPASSPYASLTSSTKKVAFNVSNVGPDTTKQSEPTQKIQIDEALDISIDNSIDSFKSSVNDSCKYDDSMFITANSFSEIDSHVEEAGIHKDGDRQDIEKKSHVISSILFVIWKCLIVLLLGIIALLLLSGGLILRQMKVNAGYCDITPQGKSLKLWSNFPNSLQEVIPQYQPYVEEVEIYINQHIHLSCEECPEHAICFADGRIKCDSNFLSERPWSAVFGLVPNQEICVYDDLIDERMRILGEVTLKLLHRRQGRALRLDELYDYLKIMKNGNMPDDEFEEFWENFIDYEMFNEPEIKIDLTSRSVSFETTIPEEYRTSTYGDRRKSKRKYMTE